VSNDRSSFVSQAEARGVGYGFLAGAFRAPPDAAMLARLATDAFLEDAKSLFGETAPVGLVTFCAEHSSDDLASAVRQDFMDLLKVPGGRYVTPYESVFRDEREVEGERVRGLLMGKPAIDVQKWYRLGAFDVAEGYDELPDHIALELAYVGALCGREREFQAAGDEVRLTRALEMERDFLAGHLCRWIDLLAERVEAKAATPYYGAVARMASSIVHDDLEALEKLLGPSSGASAPGVPSA